MHFESLAELDELLIRQVPGDRLRDRHERHVIGNAQDRKRKPVGLLDHGHGRLRKAEADAEAQPCDAVLGEPPYVLALLRLLLPYPEPGRQEELATLEELGRVGQLRHVQPAHLVAETLVSGRDAQAEPGERGDLPDGQHVAHFDIEAKPTPSPVRKQAPSP